MEELKKRKNIRLYGENYNSPGAYFMTICTQNRQCLLSQIVGTGVPDGPLRNHGASVGYMSPQIQLTPYGETADKYIRQLNDFYENIHVIRYVIMPNHIHFLLCVDSIENGPSGTPVPTVQNSTVSRFISTFKRFCNKEYGKNIWQSRSYDHIIRNGKDFEEHIKYIHENPVRWFYDELYSEQ